MRKKAAAPPDMPPVERLALAVLLFHGKGPWVQDKAREWLALTGTPEATNKVLCDLARRLLEETLT